MEKDHKGEPLTYWGGKNNMEKDKTAKQLAIEQAYGEHWDKVKLFADKDGWVKWEVISHGVTNEVNPSHDFDMEYGDYDMLDNHGCGSFKWRPISLRGIEHNNGWFRIESEEDLPKDENGVYKCLMKTGQFINYSWRQLICYYDFGEITHYKPIKKEPLPIY